MGIQRVVRGVSAAGDGSVPEPSTGAQTLSSSPLMFDLGERHRSLWMWAAMLVWAVVLMAALGIVATSAQSAMTYIASSPGNDAGETNKASATFSLSVSGTTTNLLVSLTDLATYKPNNSPDILSAVFFSLAGNPTLTKVSGVLSAGSVAVEDGSNVTGPGGVV